MQFLKLEAVCKHCNELCRSMEKVFLNLKVYLLESAISDVTDDTLDGSQTRFVDFRD